jgi:DNA-directed RNA polymerase specialized sigma24 family protein
MQGRGSFPPLLYLTRPRASEEDRAFTVLYQQLADRVTGYIAVRVGSTQVAEDLAAQTFLKVLEAMRRGKGGRTCRPGCLGLRATW